MHTKGSPADLHSNMHLTPALILQNIERARSSSACLIPTCGSCKHAICPENIQVGQLILRTSDPIGTMNRFHWRLIHQSCVANKGLETLKSRHDELINQPLLNRLKKLSVIDEKRKLPKEQQSTQGHVEELPKRSLQYSKLTELIKLNTSDALAWNPYVLARIYNIPEHYCEKICRYVKPMVEYSSTEVDTIKLIKTKVVIDVARFKTDESYLALYKKFVFSNFAKIEPRALE